MKARPILFSAPMVRALLAGTKTQTRRVLKGNVHPDAKPEHFYFDVDVCAWANGWDQWFRCPYGAPGNLLWVRERILEWRDTATDTFSHVAAYAADGYELESRERWTPSIHMPRAASRLALRITDVRVQRLTDIDGLDALAEGITREPETAPWRTYLRLWDSIHGVGSWKMNPWVWALTFDVIQANVDTLSHAPTATASADDRMTCPECGWIGRGDECQFGGGGSRYAAECPECAEFVEYVSQ